MEDREKDTEKLLMCRRIGGIFSKEWNTTNNTLLNNIYDQIVMETNSRSFPWYTLISSFFSKILNSLFLIFQCQEKKK